MAATLGRVPLVTRRTLAYLALMVVTLATGLAVRFRPLGLPAFAVKYGGSTMWALMLYWPMALVRPRWPVGTVVTVAGAMATAVEFLKLYRVGWLDAFRGTLPGILLLGRYFAWRDILAYWIAIGIGAVVDRYGLRPFVVEHSTETPL